MWVKRILIFGICIAALLSGCGPETLSPDSAPPRGQAQPAVREAASPEPAAIEPTPAAPELEVSPPITENVPLTEPTAVLTATSAPVETVASPIIPSLAITDPAKVDIFKIAEEHVEAGDAAFPIQVTLGEGEEAMQIKASKPQLLRLPCFPRQPAPQGSNYLCQLGGGLESELWIATWGQGLNRLVTGQAIGGAVWSGDGKRVAFATLAGQDEAGNVPLKILDLETNQQIVVGMMSSPYQMAFTPDDELIYVYDSALEIVVIPRELTQGVSPVKTIPLVDIPNNQSYLAGSAAWFKVSPTGNKVAIMREWGGETGQLSMLDIADGQEMVIEEQVRNNAYSLPNIYAWSPDGSALTYLTMVEEGSVEEETIAGFSELWLTDANGENRRRIWRSDQSFLDYSTLTWLPSKNVLLATAEVEAFSDLVQVFRVGQGEMHDLFQSGKGMNLFEKIPDLSLILMQNVFDLVEPEYDIVVLAY